MGSGHRRAGARVRHGAFTLVEVLVALAIMAVVGVIANRMLTSTVEARERFTMRSEALRALQRGMLRLDRDVGQIVARPVRDEYGDPVPGLRLEDGELEFTRAGWRNPRGERRPSLQRVRYAVDRAEETLVRTSWPVLDRAVDTEPFVYALLEGVAAAEIRVLDGAGAPHLRWPPAEAGEAPAPAPAVEADPDDVPAEAAGEGRQEAEAERRARTTPAAVELLLETRRFGPLRRLYPIAWFEARSLEALREGPPCDPVVDPDCAPGGAGRGAPAGAAGAPPRSPPEARPDVRR